MYSGDLDRCSLHDPRSVSYRDEVVIRVVADLPYEDSLWTRHEMFPSRQRSIRRRPVGWRACAAIGAINRRLSRNEEGTGPGTDGTAETAIFSRSHRCPN